MTRPERLRLLASMAYGNDDLAYLTEILIELSRLIPESEMRLFTEGA